MGETIHLQHRNKRESSKVCASWPDQLKRVEVGRQVIIAGRSR